MKLPSIPCGDPDTRGVVLPNGVRIVVMRLPHLATAAVSVFDARLTQDLLGKLDALFIFLQISRHPVEVNNQAFQFIESLALNAIAEIPGGDSCSALR